MPLTRGQAAAKIQQLLDEMRRVHQEALAKLADLQGRQRAFYRNLSERWDREALERASKRLKAKDTKENQDQ